MKTASLFIADKLLWLLGGVVVYLMAIRKVTEVNHWLAWVLGYGFLVVLPFTLIQKIVAGFGVEVDLVWVFITLALAGFVPD